MHSEQLAEYLRTGVIAPLQRRCRKSDVEVKLGAPDDWKGRIAGIGWDEEPLANFWDALHWHYGALCVSFDADDQLTGISLDYYEIVTPICFPAAFTMLPDRRFTLGELEELMRSRGIGYRGRVPDSDIVLVSEGGIAAVTLYDSDAPETAVTYLFSYESGDCA